MELTLTNSAGEKIDYTFQPAQGEAKAGWLVILGHGVTGNKDRPIITSTAKALNEAGFDTLAISFSGNGDSEGDFRESTITKEVGDLTAVIDAVSERYAHLAYVGHSMGGAVGVIQAAKDDRIEALVSLAGMVNTKNFAQTEFGEDIPDDGFMWGEKDCPLSSAFMKDLCETVVSVLPQAERIACPWLLLHGTADDVVLPQDTESIVRAKHHAVKAVLVDGADHSFSSVGHNQLVTKAVATWFEDIAG